MCATVYGATMKLFIFTSESAGNWQGKVPQGQQTTRRPQTNTKHLLLVLVAPSKLHSWITAQPVYLEQTEEEL